ncbi:WASH complex subunit 7 [Kipferlia bialata]|uniref:WASH complex subunit 7 n=1 Tax=Kipferlia bialata TaxID=797122 RepID=A0A9K3CX71_9EUKA|nr:WASH complex subunit 7 [Kipferlia bialata]|eukprot:g6167.t1
MSVQAAEAGGYAPRLALSGIPSPVGEEVVSTLALVYFLREMRASLAMRQGAKHPSLPGEFILTRDTIDLLVHAVRLYPCVALSGGLCYPVSQVGYKLMVRGVRLDTLKRKDKKMLKSIEGTGLMKDYLSVMGRTFKRNVTHILKEIRRYLAYAERTLQTSVTDDTDLSVSVLLHGVRIASTASSVLTLYPLLHTRTRTAFPASDILPLASLGGGVHRLREGITRLGLPMSECLGPQIRSACSTLHKIYLRASQRVENALRKAKGEAVGSLRTAQCLLNVCQTMTASPHTHTRASMLRVSHDLLLLLNGVLLGSIEEDASAALGSAGGKRLSEIWTCRVMLQNLAKLSLMSSDPLYISRSSDCCVLYHVRKLLLKSVCRQVQSNPSVHNVSVLTSVLPALSDATVLIRQARHLDSDLLMSPIATNEDDIQQILQAASRAQGQMEKERERGPGEDMADDLSYPGAVFVSSLRRETEYHLKGLLDSVSDEIENDVRLMAKSIEVLEIAEQSHPSVVTKRHLYQNLLDHSFQYQGRVLDPRQYVATRIGRALYDQVTVFPGKWAVYSRMLALSKEIYGLSLPHFHLRLATTSNQQGVGTSHGPGSEDTRVDVLNIMRNIDQFVRSYNYSLHSQFFIQSVESAKSRDDLQSVLKGPILSRKGALSRLSLRTLTNDDICLSLRQHGVGVLPTAVNFIYSFLVSELSSLSHFLIDGLVVPKVHECSRRWAQYIEEVSTETNRAKRTNLSMAKRLSSIVHASEAVRVPYPPMFAREVLKTMQGLGRDEAGQFHIDKFRDLITEIGNALGFVRLLRAAGATLCAESLQFLPDPREAREKYEISAETDAERQAERERARADGTLEACALDSNLPAGAIGSLTNVDRCISAYADAYNATRQHFRSLLLAFKAAVPEDLQKQIGEFHVIIPAVTLSHVKQMVSLKNNLKHDTRDGAFTNDGFALGLAYVLNVLGRYQDFEALMWWKAVKTEYSQAVKEGRVPASLSAESATIDGAALDRDERQFATKESKQIATAALSEELAEFQLLESAYHACSVFFLSA